MSILPSTGIEAVDRELERRAPFASSEAAEAVAAQLLRVWRALQPGSEDAIVLRSRRRKQRRE
jgi:hypothetical protein